MGGSNVIADVSETLRFVLEEKIGAAATVVMHDLEPPYPTPPAVSLFMFEAAEDPSSRNRPRRRGIADSGGAGLSVQKPTMSLVLRYLITPWGTTPATDQQLMGQILETFYDEPILHGNRLQGDLAGIPNADPALDIPPSNDAIKLTLAPITLEERTRIWAATNRPYRLSVTYDARVINLDPAAGIEVPTVGTRRLDVGEVSP